MDSVSKSKPQPSETPTFSNPFMEPVTSAGPSRITAHHGSQHLEVSGVQQEHEVMVNPPLASQGSLPNFDARTRLPPSSSLASDSTSLALFRSRNSRGSWLNRRATLVDHDDYERPSYADMFKPPVDEYLDDSVDNSYQSKTKNGLFSSLRQVVGLGTSKSSSSSLPNDISFPSDPTSPDAFSPTIQHLGSSISESNEGQYLDRQVVRKPRLKTSPIIIKNIRSKHLLLGLDLCLINSYNPGMEKRREFVLKLAQALLYFGAPSHRIESQLAAVSKILETEAAVVHIPSIIVITFGNVNSKTVKTHFIRATGKIALTALEQVNAINRDVCRDKIACDSGTFYLTQTMDKAPMYIKFWRCCFAFICSSIICVVAFGGSLVDVGISGICGFALQWLALRTQEGGTMLDNVYECVRYSSCA